MKRVFNKSNVFSFLIGILLCGSIVSAATLIDSKDVTYTSSDSSFDANNVETALNELYSKIENSNNFVGYTYGYNTITYSNLQPGHYKVYCTAATVASSYYDVTYAYYDYSFNVTGGTYTIIDSDSGIKVYDVNITDSNGNCSFTTTKWSGRLNSNGLMLVFKK